MNAGNDLKAHAPHVRTSAMSADPQAEYRVEASRLDARRWSEVLAQFDDANVYQTRAYGAVHWGESQLEHVVLKRNNTLIAAAQVRVMTVPVLGKGIAYLRWGPMCCRCGESSDPSTLRRMIEALKTEFVGRRGLVLRVLPSVFENDSTAALMNLACADFGLIRKEDERPYRTLRVDLRPALPDLRKRLNQKWRNGLNNAERNGLTLRAGTDIELFDRFLGAYNQMRTRKQFETTVDAAEFRRMQLLLPEPEKLQVLVCEKDDRLLNAIVISGMGNAGIYLLGATTEEGLNLKGAYLLQWRAVQWLKERGCRWYDLGGINPEANPGVFHFKNGMSGEDVSQLGTFEAGRGVSAFCVRAGERARSLAKSLRAWKRQSAGRENGKSS